jgi:hypothetical protein
MIQVGNVLSFANSVDALVDGIEAASKRCQTYCPKLFRIVIFCIVNSYKKLVFGILKKQETILSERILLRFGGHPPSQQSFLSLVADRLSTPSIPSTRISTEFAKERTLPTRIISAAVGTSPLRPGSGVSTYENSTKILAAVNSNRPKPRSLYVYTNGQR